MKIEKAYSIDLGEIIDVETAYDFFWAGCISNKHNFECEHEDCDAAVTAANLDKLRQDMVYDPYYRVVDPEKHSSSCPYRKIAKPVATVISYDKAKDSRGKIDLDLADEFGLTRPPSHFEKKTVTTCEDVTNGSASTKKHTKNIACSQERRASTHYSLLAFVSKYSRYRKRGITSQKFINIKKYNISYDDMFVEIMGQSLGGLSEYSRVYYGKAFVRRLNNGDYAIRFESSFVVDEEPLSPSIYIRRNTIDSAFTRKLSEGRFEALSKNGAPTIWAFIYAKPYLRKKDGKQYVNFNVENMDWFDFRERFS